MAAQGLVVTACPSERHNMGGPCVGRGGASCDFIFFFCFSVRACQVLRVCYFFALCFFFFFFFAAATVAAARGVGDPEGAGVLCAHVVHYPHASKRRWPTAKRTLSGFDEWHQRTSGAPVPVCPRRVLPRVSRRVQLLHAAHLLRHAARSQRVAPRKENVLSCPGLLRMNAAVERERGRR